jgi:hypothetical protein
MLTLLAMIEVDRLDGAEPPAEVVVEADALFRRLNVHVAPAVPLSRA